MRVVCAAIVASALAVMPATASDEDAIMDAFSAYSAAIEAGDLATAADAGLEAWRAAEAVWGETQPETAILAYNAARTLVDASRVTEAAEPAERALALAEAGRDGGAVPQDFARVIAAFSAAESAPDDRRARRDMRRALEAASGAPDMLTAVAAFKLGSLYLSNDESALAVELAERAERELVALDASPIDIVAAIMLQGAGALTEADSEREVRAARETFERAIAAYPKGVSYIDEPLPARLVTWRSAARALERTYARNERADRAPEDAPAPFLSRLPDGVSCDVEWASRTTPEYPSGMRRNGRVAGVMVGYDLTEAGETTNIRVLANVGGDRFDQSIIDAVATWRGNVDAEPASADSAACRSSRTTNFEFVLR